MDKYDGKREYAAQVMHDEARKVEGVLTEEQIAIIADVRVMRHKIHSAGLSMFNGESGEAAEYYPWLEGIGERIGEIGGGKLPPYAPPYKPEAIITDVDVYELDMPRDEAEAEHLAQMGKVNESLEAWLGAVDKMYGTAFAPTGWGRLWG
jgi:hypothetical protein